MISDVNTNYNSICKHFDFSKETTANINKKKLLEIARNGGDRPKKPSKLGNSFHIYTNPNNPCFDENFRNKIKETRPDWFLTHSDILKIELIKMANNGEKRPKQKTKIGGFLCKKTTGKYTDKTFTKKLKRARPDWFIKFSDIKKEELIKLACVEGAKRPSQKTKLGKSLSHYTNEAGGSYDKKFTKTIKSLQPEWFVTNKDKSSYYKQKLIEMAIKKCKRPSYNSVLGHYLSNYTTGSHGSYDKNFSRKIKNLIPSWFVSQTEIANQKKQNIIQMAKKGSKRKVFSRCISNYTCKKHPSYDKNFDILLRKIRPDWFRK